MQKVHLRLDGSNLSIEQLIPIFEGNMNIHVEIDDIQQDAIMESRGTVDLIVAKKLPVYGISTGFGKFKEIYIPSDQMVNLQRNLIISHASCVGSNLQPHQVLIMMIMRLNCLVRGYSGVRPYLLEKLREGINKQILPKVPCQGSVGASGDLAPLSHLALGLMGQGEIWDGSKYSPAAEVLQERQYEPIVYMEKEGLAMNNGTQMMGMLNAETFHRGQRILEIADIAFGLTAFATKSNLKQLLQLQGCTNGQQKTLKCLRQLLPLQTSNFNNPKSIQSAVAVHGIIHDTLDYAGEIIQREINSTSDNPIIDNDEKTAKSGGNFHGEYMAQVADMLCMALQRLAIYSERRQERLVNSELGQCGLPMFLTGQGGVLNGYMIPQYTSAAIVSENKVLCNPSCVDTVPTSANIEDHVSMGAYGARKALQLVKNVEYVVTIELMCACQALEFYDGQLPANIEKVRSFVRTIVPDVKNQDIFMSEYIEALADEIKSGKLTEIMIGLML